MSCHSGVSHKSASFYWANVWRILAADRLTFEGNMGDFRKKNILQTDFEGGKACKEIPGKNSIQQWPKQCQSWVIMLKKKLHRYMSGQKFLTPEVWGKNSSQTKSPMPPQKSNGQPLIKGWEKKRIWHLSKWHSSTKWLARGYHVVVFKFCILRVCPWENQAGGDNAQITDFAQTWHNWWVWWDINLHKK